MRYGGIILHRAGREANAITSIQQDSQADYCAIDGQRHDVHATDSDLTNDGMKIATVELTNYTNLDHPPKTILGH